MRSLYSILRKSFDDPDAVVHELWLHCLETICRDSEKSQEIFRSIHEILSPLAHREIDRTITLITALCSEHEFQGFLYGLRAGAQLMGALNTPTAGNVKLPTHHPVPGL